MPMPVDVTVTVRHPDATAPSERDARSDPPGRDRHSRCRGPPGQSAGQRHRRRRRDLRGPRPGRGDAHGSARPAARGDEHRAARGARRCRGLQHVRYAALELLAHERGRRRQVAADGRRAADGDDPRVCQQPGSRRRHHGSRSGARAAGDRRRGAVLRAKCRRPEPAHARSSRSPRRRSRRRSSWLPTSRPR